MRMPLTLERVRQAVMTWVLKRAVQFTLPEYERVVTAFPHQDSIYVVTTGTLFRFDPRRELVQAEHYLRSF